MTTKKLNKKFIDTIKTVLLVVSSNIFFYLIFFPSSDNSCHKIEPAIAGHVAIDFPTISFIQPQEGKALVTLLDTKYEVIAQKAYLIASSSTNRQSETNDQSPLHHHLLVPEEVLPKIIELGSKKNYLLAYPYSNLPIQKNRSANYEIEI